MKKQFLCAFFSVMTGIVFLSAVQAAQAQEQKAQATVTAPEPLDADGQRLKDQLTRNMVLYQNMKLFKTGGDVKVVKKTGYYEATLPFMSVHGKDKSRFDIGFIKINAVPNTAAKQWKMAMALPENMLAYDPQGKMTLKVIFKDQKFSGVWSEDLNNFIKVDSQYNNIVLKSMQYEGLGNIASITSKMNLMQDAQGLWAGPMTMDASNITYAEGNGISSKIGSAKFVSSMSGYSPKGFADYTAKMAEITKSAAGLNDAQKSDAVAGIFGGLSSSFNDSLSSVTFNDIEFSKIDKTTKLPATIKLEQLAFHSNAKGLSTDAASYELAFSYQGFSMVPESPEFSSIVPSVMNVGLEMQNIPTKKLASGGGQPSALLEKVSTSNTALAVKSLKIGNKQYMIDFTGALKADPVKKFAGQFQGKITGLIPLVERMKTAAQNLPQEKQGSFMMMLMPISMVDTYGKADPADPNTKTYDIQIKPEGITVNGIAVGGTASAPTAAQDSISPVSAR